MSRLPRNLPFRLGLALLALGTGPLLLYVVFGPADGNPIGLGLLFIASAPVAAGCLLWGLLLRDRQRRAGPRQDFTPGVARTPGGPGRPRRPGDWP